MDEKKDIEVVSGDGSNLNISPAYDHLNVEAHKSGDKKPKNIVIPKNVTKKSDEEKDKNDNKEEKKEN